MEAVVMIAIQLTSLFLQVMWALLKLVIGAVKMIFSIFRFSSSEKGSEKG